MDTANYNVSSYCSFCHLKREKMFECVSLTESLFNFLCFSVVKFCRVGCEVHSLNVGGIETEWKYGTVGSGSSCAV